MNIVLTAVGSTGDIQPFLPLAAALSHRGHNVTVRSRNIYTEKISGLNVTLVAWGTPINLV